ncbi:MAG TPA: DUF4397 domain-containing protein [Puia sp.]|nr:DUF4397 domain-containing protein [Puia sp.]
MKKLKSIILVSSLAVVTGFFSCKRDMALRDPAVPVSGNSANISLIDVAPNLSTVLGVKADTFNVLFNSVKVSGYTVGTSPVMTFSGIYPLAGTATGYASIPAGDQTIKFARGVNTQDSLVLFTFNESLQANSYYTLLITDSIKSGNDAARMFLKDNFTPVDTGFYNMRFVNAVLNDTAGVDVWSKQQAKNIFANVKPGSVVDFAKFNSSWGTDTLFCRRAGTAVGLDTLLTQNFYSLRTYTLVYKGNAFSAVKTDTKRRHLITYVNR